MLVICRMSVSHDCPPSSSSFEIEDSQPAKPSEHTSDPFHTLSSPSTWPRPIQKSPYQDSRVASFSLRNKLLSQGKDVKFYFRNNHSLQFRLHSLTRFAAPLKFPPTLVSKPARTHSLAHCKLAHSITHSSIDSQIRARFCRRDKFVHKHDQTGAWSDEFIGNASFRSLSSPSPVVVPCFLISNTVFGTSATWKARSISRGYL